MPYGGDFDMHNSSQSKCLILITWEQFIARK